MMEALHFVRPQWLLAFIPLLILLALLYRHHGNSANWKAVCDAKLLPFILAPGAGKSSRLPLWLAALAASLAILAAAGPAFEKLPTPVYREQSSLVMLLDLSRSMDAGDLKPSRLERAKLKLLDILKTRKAGQTALIVYAADAFTVTPLTDDSNTIANLVPTLETGLMPSQGSHAFTAIDSALALLKQAGVNRGDVLLITDDITERDLSAIEKLSAAGHRLSVMGVGTEAGSPVSLSGGFLQDSSGAIVIAKLDPQKLQQAALTGGGLYVGLEASDADINTLNKLFSSREVSDPDQADAADTELTADIWQEEGPWLLLLVIPLVALWPRRGWLLCLTALILPVPEPAYALDSDHLWRNPDQQAMQLFNAGDAAGAAEKFQQHDWKAAAHYRAGDYEKAIEALPKPSSSRDYYNRGNALAKSGRLPEALDAYDQALELDTNNEDARFNREQVKQAIKQQQQEQSGEGENNEDGEDSQQDQDGEQNSKDQSGEPSSEQSTNQSDNQSQSEQKPSADNSAGENSDSENQQAQKNNTQSEQNSAAQNQAGDDTAAQSAQPQQDQNNIEQALKDAQQKQPQNTEHPASEDEQATPPAHPLQQTELSEDEQAVEQWLKRVPDHPEQLLRRKFLYQYKNMEQQTPSEQSW